MAQKNERWLDQTGLNLIRIVIGSYFMAVSLDLVVGVNQRVLFLPFTSPALADLIGSTALFSASIAFMTGVYLRSVALALALFVLSSSLIHNFLLVEVENISDFWRDLTLACAVILNYSSLGRHDMRRASVMRRYRRSKARKVLIPGKEITPRRVVAPSLIKRPIQRDIRTALNTPQPKSKSKAQTTVDDPMDTNLFLNV